MARMNNQPAVVRDRASYERAFEAERQRAYPVVDALEEEFGFAMPREELEDAARVLACPVKLHPPNWQHGRVLYALGRQYFESLLVAQINILDIGTAKGFSALCLQRALNDSGRYGCVTSVDVINPHGTAPRNSVAEVSGSVTLYEILEAFPESRAIEFRQSTGIDYLRSHVHRLHFVFVDGKHTAEVVSAEAAYIAKRQETGDLVLFDDAQLPMIDAALLKLRDYSMRRFEISRERAYVIARRK